MPWNIKAIRCVVQCVADQAGVTRVAGDQRDLAVGGHTAVRDTVHSAPNALICIGSHRFSSRKGKEAGTSDSICSRRETRLPGAAQVNELLQWAGVSSRIGVM